MPDPSAHKKQAQHNQKVAINLEAHDPDALDWAITIRFYAALHLVRAYLAKRGLQPKTHGETFDYLTRKSDLPEYLVAAYRRFYKLSRKVRYDCWTPSQRDVNTARQLLSQVEMMITPHLR